jgi:hypothetical protein
MDLPNFCSLSTTANDLHEISEWPCIGICAVCRKYRQS